MMRVTYIIIMTLSLLLNLIICVGIFPTPSKTNSNIDTQFVCQFSYLRAHQSRRVMVKSEFSHRLPEPVQVFFVFFSFFLGGRTREGVKPINSKLPKKKSFIFLFVCHKWLRCLFLFFVLFCGLIYFLIHQKKVHERGDTGVSLEYCYTCSSATTTYSS